MKRGCFDFWYKGHQVIATYQGKGLYYFYVFCVRPDTYLAAAIASSVSQNATFAEIGKGIILKGGENTDVHTSYVLKHAYSLYAAVFRADYKAGIHFAEETATNFYKFEGPMREYKEFTFPGGSKK